MATKDTKVTAGQVVSATVKYTNLDDETRKFDISADVNIQDKKVTNFNSGVVSKKESVDYGNANFGAAQDLSYFSFNSNGLNMEETKEAVSSVLAFIEDVKENVESHNTAE